MDTRYEITVAGEPGPTLRAALPDFVISPGPEGCMTLAGPVKDQAALQGVLQQLHGLHVELIEVHQVVE